MNCISVCDGSAITSLKMAKTYGVVYTFPRNILKVTLLNVISWRLQVKINKLKKRFYDIVNCQVTTLNFQDS